MRCWATGSSPSREANAGAGGHHAEPDQLARRWATSPSSICCARGSPATTSGRWSSSGGRTATWPTYRLRQLLNLPLDQPLALTTELGDTALVAAARLARAGGDAGRHLARRAGAGASGRRGGHAAGGPAARGARRSGCRSSSSRRITPQLGYPGNGSPVGTNYLADWAVSLGVQLPLFTGGRIRGERDVARANLEEARLRRASRPASWPQLDARNAQLQLEAAEAAWAGERRHRGAGARAPTRSPRSATARGSPPRPSSTTSRIQLAQAQANRAQAARDLQVARMRLALLPALPLTAQTAAAAAAATSPVSAPLAGTSGSRATPNAARGQRRLPAFLPRTT